MSVKDLVVLGTSSQQPTRYRSHGAYLIRWNDEGLLFDPGEGTQRQFIFANIAPPIVTRIFISHFHGDHCLGLGSMLMRLNLDKVSHPIHCYFPASGKHYFDRLRYSTAYHETINVIEHPIERPGGLIHDDGTFRIEALFLDHGIDTVGWRISEPDAPRFYVDKLQQAHIVGPLVKELATTGSITIGTQSFTIEDVGYIRKGDIISVIADTRPCPNATQLALNSRLMLSESTYLHQEHHMAIAHKHLTASEAATIAKEAGAQQLVLAHFSARYPNSAAFATEAQAIFPHTIAADDLQKISFRDTRPAL